MKELQFKELCEVCDNFLLESNLSESRVSISWLHILKFHPIFLKEYKHLFYEKDSFKRIRSFLQLIYFSSITAYRIVKGLYSKRIYSSKNINNMSSDILIISHLENIELLNKKNDFYFGDIPNKLREFGMTSTVALINHISVNKYSLPSGWLDSENNHILINNSISFFDELKIYLAQIKESISLRKIKPQSNLVDRIANEAAIQVFSPTTANNLRLKKQVSNIIKVIKPKCIMLTYEGHAWERLLFAEAKKIDPQIKCIGYQHALINQQYSLYRCLGGNFDPDVIATSGEIDLEKFNQRINNNKIAKINIGSSKKIFNELFVEKDFVQNSVACLVLFDGVKEECVEMLLFTNSLANNYPQVKFILRLHPRIDKRLLLKECPILTGDKSNIVWSSSSLEKDFEMSHLSLYRGSTAIFGASSFDVLPVFFDNEEGFYMDPLSDLVDTRFSIKDVKKFNDIVKFRKSQSYKIVIKKIFKYCNRKINNLNVEPLVHTIQNN
jgi:hypothetical protein